MDYYNGIKYLVRLGQQGRENGTINEVQYRDLMQQIVILKESSLIREAENKENRMGGRGAQFEGGHGSFNGGAGPFPGGPQGGLLGPPPSPQSLLTIPEVPRPQEMVPTTTRSPHKNDLPLADSALLQEIEQDPTKTLNIDDIPRTIRYFGETATIVMEDNLIAELSFQVRVFLAT